MADQQYELQQEEIRGQETLARVRALLFLLVCVVLGLSVVLYLEDQLEAEARNEAGDLGHAHLRLVSERLNASLSATYALSALVRQGAGRIADFDRVAGDLLRLYPGAAALQLAPDGVIHDVVPMAGNEAAVGHDLLKDPQRNREAFVAVQTRKLTLAGPFKLVQGGVGTAGRLPVFLPDGQGGERFWGFTIVLLRFPDVLAGAGLERIPERGYRYALWRPVPGAEPWIMAASDSGIPSDAVEIEMGVPNGRWVLSIAPRAGWLPAGRVWAVRLAVVALSAFAAFWLFGLLATPVRLRREVARRTRALRDSEERFRALVESSPDLIWLKDPDGRYMTCNRRFEEAFGVSREQILGRTDFDFAPPDLARAWSTSDREVIATGRSAGSQEWLGLGDERRELLQTLKTPMRDGDGRLVGVLGVGRDITRLHTVSEEYRASEARLNAAQQVARIGSWERDLESGDLYWSREVFRLFEFDPVQVTPSYEHFMEVIHPEDREWVDHAYAKARAQRRSLQVQMRLAMPDGRVKHIEMRTEFPEPQPGEPARVVGTLQDVSERVAAQERIRQQQAMTRAMLAAIPVGVAITDTDGRIREFNSAAAELLMEKPPEIAGRNLAELGLEIFDSEGRRLAAQELPDGRVLGGEAALRDVELVLQRGEQRVEVAMSAVPVAREHMGVVLALVDLAARRQAEASLRENMERIESLARRFSIAADAAGIGVWEFDLAAQRFSWDDAMFRLHGLAEQRFDGSLAGWLEYVLPQDRARLALALERARGGVEDMDVDFRVHRRSGDPHYLRACARAASGPQQGSRSMTGVCLDMTTLKRSEQILIQERRRYRDLVDSTDGIVWEADAPTARFTFVSQHAERLLGYPIKQWYEPGFWVAHIHPDDREWAPAHCAALSAKLQSHEFEYRMLAGDGRTVWLRDIVTVVPEGSAPRWLRGVMIDITEARRTAEALSRSEEQLSMAIDGAGLGLWDWDIAGGKLDIGAQGLRMLGYEAGDVEPHFAGWQALIHPDDIARVQRALDEHLWGESPRFACEYRLRHRESGRWVWVTGLGRVMARDADGLPQRASGIQLDVTERRIAEERVRCAQTEVERLSERNALLLNSAGEGIFGVDRAGRFIFINPRALELLRVTEVEALNRPFGELFQHRHDDGRPFLPRECPIVRTLEDGSTRQLEDILVRQDGTVLPVRMMVTEMREGERRVGVEVVFQDVTARRAMERELQRLATTDPLTGVTNRRLFIECCARELERYKRFGDALSLLMIDIDHFKQVNDTYGHAAGDAALLHVAELASRELRRTDLFARLGGEEFAFLLAGCDLAGAMEFASRFRGLVEDNPAPTEAGDIALTISIGAAEADPRDGGADDLLRRADAALYRAKEGGRNRVEAVSLE